MGKGGGAACSGDGGQVHAVTFFYIAHTAKIGRAAQPQQPRHNTGPTLAFGWSLGEGACRQRGVINRIGGWGRGR